MKDVDKIVKLEAEIDFTKEPTETRVKPTDGEMWMDFGYWMEVAGFMAYQAMKYQEWTPEKMEEYVKKYIGKCLRGYTKKI